MISVVSSSISRYALVEEKWSSPVKHRSLSNSHGIWTFIFTKRSWVGYMKLRCGINPISHGWLLDKYLFCRKAIQEVKEPSHGIWEFIQWLSANQNTTNFLEVEQLPLLPCWPTIGVSDRDSAAVIGRTCHVIIPMLSRIAWPAGQKIRIFGLSFAEVEMD